MTLSTGILAMIALAVGGTLTAAVLYAVLTRGRDWRREFFSLRVLPFVFVGLAVGLTTFAIGIVAKDSADEALEMAVDDIESDCDDQLSLLLQADASVYVEALAASNRLSSADLKRISDYLSIDEATVYDRDGRVVCTTDPGLKVGDVPFHWDNEEMRPYRDLLTGRRRTLRQRFRPNVAAPDRIMKYFARTLPQGGVLQIGYLWETFEREFKEYFETQFEYRMVGESGFCLMFDGRNRLVLDAAGHPDVKGMTAAEVGLTDENLAVPLGTVFRARLFGTPCRCLFYEDRIADRKIMAAVPLSEGETAILALACGIAFVFFAAFLVFRLIIRKFRQQQAKIDALREKEEAHRAADLALARAIQRAELRTDGAEGKGYRLATLMNAAREVGGDFYDYYTLPDGRLVLTIADVSGKGIPAAFFMMKARLTLKSCVYSCVAGTGTDNVPPLADAIARANVRLARNNPAEMFVTAWVGIFDRTTGTLDYVSAGHNPPLVCHEAPTADREPATTWLDAPRCAALGVFEAAKYRAARMTLAPGDRLFLYTDGVTEAMNKAGELFGNERLEQTLGGGQGLTALPETHGGGQGLTALPETHGRARIPSAPPINLISRVSRALETFVDGAEQSDDITMLELAVVKLRNVAVFA